MNKTILFILVIITTCLWFTQARHFYHFKDGTTLTLWKTVGGKCYLVPGYYLSPFKPDINYISTSNLSLIHIVIDRKTKFDFIVSSSLDYSSPTKINLPDFSTKHYPSYKFNDFAHIYLNDTILNKGTEHLSVHIEDMVAVLNGEVQ